jgi:hypothetical protein
MRFAKSHRSPNFRSCHSKRICFLRSAEGYQPSSNGPINRLQTTLPTAFQRASNGLATPPLYPLRLEARLERALPLHAVLEL